MRSRVLPVVLLLLILATLLPSPVWKPAEGQSNDEVMLEGIPIVQRSGDLVVKWVLVKQAPFTVNITVQNLQPVKRLVNLTLLLDNLSIPVSGLKVEGFYEWKNVSYTVTVPDYGTVLQSLTFANVKNLTVLTGFPAEIGEETGKTVYGSREGPFYAVVEAEPQPWMMLSNETRFTVGFINYTEAKAGSMRNVTFHWLGTGIVGYHTETRFRMDWKPCKTQMLLKTSTVYRSSMETITLPPYGSKPKDGTVNGSKQFRVVFNTPLVNGTAIGRIALEASDQAGVRVFDPWFNSSWKYRVSHVINPASGAGVNYTVRITVHYGTGENAGEHAYLDEQCRSDFGDVRFTASDGSTLLSYWLQEKVDGDHAVFWVKIPDNLNSTSATIYLYYGNPGATTTSNLQNTFKRIIDGLVLSLPMDEGSGSITYDKSGNGNNGTIYGATWVDGRIGKALSFDGVDDYVRVPNSASIRNFTSMTIIIWLYKTSPVTVTEFPFDYGYWRSPNYGLVSRITTAYGLELYIRNTAGSAVPYIFGVPPPSWWMYGASWDGSTVRWIKNGAFIGTSSLAGTIDPAVPLYLGSGQEGAAQFYKGLIDEVRVYSRALSAGEISDLYTNYAFEVPSNSEAVGKTIVRKYVYPEPSHGAWGSVETRPLSPPGGAVLSWSQQQDTGVQSPASPAGGSPATWVSNVPLILLTLLVIILATGVTVEKRRTRKWLKTRRKSKWED